MKLILLSAALALVFGSAKANDLQGCNDYEYFDDMLYYGGIIEVDLGRQDELFVANSEDGRIYKVTFKGDSACFQATNKKMKVSKKK